ncbi:FkbM family methyltransferase [Candidiatus Paracoxiella cheracis]|uniref:FkbM family methyltransferase n=1 Tax=Candidiatus Paracoxiella cheracis TaxID=3405120 RepID=UPI003BF569C9
MISIIKYCGIQGFFVALYYRLLIMLNAQKQEKRFIKKKIYNYEMYLDLQDPGISRTLLLFGKRELEHKIMLEKVLKPGMTVLDIGANIGYYAIMESKLVGSAGKIIAVAPSPSNIALLKCNVELNGCKNVDVFQGAISDTNAEREFFMANSSNLNTFHNTGSGIHDLTGETIKVKTMTVVDVMENIAKPDLIRMDVEGHEVEVINGMLPVIQNGEFAPMIIFETHITRYNKDHDMELVLRALFNCGYRVQYLASNAESGIERVCKKRLRKHRTDKNRFCTSRDF